MGLLERVTKYDTCVYWAPTTKTQFGKQLFDEPVELGCRWDETISLNLNPQSKELLFDVRVIVPQDVEEDGMLWHGKLSDVPVDEEEGPRVPPDDALQIKKFTKTGKLRNNKFLRQAYL